MLCYMGKGHATSRMPLVEPQVIVSDVRYVPIPLMLCIENYVELFVG